jgi:hypothetical protein
MAHIPAAAWLPCLQAVPLLVKVLAKSMDTSLATDKIEISTLTRDESTGKVCMLLLHNDSDKIAATGSWHCPGKASTMISAVSFST